MANLSESDAIWMQFIIPVIQACSTVTIAYFANRQEKWSRITLSEKFLERLTKLVSAYDMLTRLTLNKAEKDECYAALLQCKQALLEASLAARLYRKEKNMESISAICDEGLRLMDIPRSPVSADTGTASGSDVVSRLNQMAARARLEPFKLPTEKKEKLKQLRQQLYNTVGREFNIANTLESI